MMALNIIYATIHIMIPFSIIMWLSIFFNTSRHLKDYKKKERVKTGIITTSITAIIVLTLLLILKNLKL